MSSPSAYDLADAIEHALGHDNHLELAEIVGRTPPEAFERGIAKCRDRNRARHTAAMSAAESSTAAAAQNVERYYAREAKLDRLRDTAAQSE
jgi:hypothetical protein